MYTCVLKAKAKGVMMVWKSAITECGNPIYCQGESEGLSGFLVYDDVSLEQRIIQTGNTADVDVEAILKVLNETEASSTHTVNNTPAQLPESTDQDVIWMANRRPTPLDMKASEQLIKIYSRDNFQLLFNDRKTVKKYVWQKIGQEMLKYGFNFGTGDVALIGEKCDQKWRNLEKSYNDYNKHSDRTGSSGGRKLPVLYDELHAVIGKKHATKPKIILESSASSSKDCAVASAAPISDDLMQIDCSDISNPGTSRRPLKVMRHIESDNETDITGDEDLEHFKNVKHTLKPKKNKVSHEDILKTMGKLHKEEMEAQSKQFTALQEYLKNSTAQKDKLLEILAGAFSKKD